MKKWCFIFLISWTFNIYALLSVEVTPNLVALGQDVQLILKKKDNASNGLPDGLPDFSPLEKDFSIVGTQQSHTFQNINGVTHQEDTWTILMNPKHQGKIMIPALVWGQEKSQVISLDVQAMDKTQTSSNQIGESVFLKWDIEPQNPMVHEQVKIKLKIYHSEPLLDAKLTPPSVENGLLFALDSQTHLFEIVNNQRYQVEQYRYIVYPQTKGKMRIHAPILDALEYGMIPTPIHQTLAEKTLSVMPSSSKNAVPAENLMYQERLPLSSKIGLPLGDTIVRKIEIIAQGLPAQLIPDIQPSCGQGCKVYMNPPKVDNQMQGGQLFGHKIFEITYLPQQQGATQLEAIDIPWFNTQTRQSKVLKIPAIPIEIFATKVHPTRTHHEPSSKSWVGALLGFLLGGLLMGLGRYIHWKKIFEQIMSFEVRHYTLKRACIRQDASEARLALLKWARAQKFEYPIRDLHDIARQIPDGELKIEIKTMIAYLFSRRVDKSWQGARLWRAFKRFKLQKTSMKNDEQAFSRLNP